VIARAAGIGNPKRFYVMRKNRSAAGPAQLSALAGPVLEIEASLKLGSQTGERLRDWAVGGSPR